MKNCIRNSIYAVLLAILTSGFMTGCVSSQDRNSVISALQKENIIKEEWEQRGYIAKDASPIPTISSYDYYYTDDNGEIYEVSIRPNMQENSDGKKNCYVYVTDSIEIYDMEKVERNNDTDELKYIISDGYRHTAESTTTYFNAVFEGKGIIVTPISLD